MKCTDAHNKTHVTISIPREAGDNLKYLAKFNTQLLERLGILAIRVDGAETFTTCAKSGEQISRGRPPLSSTSSGEKCVDQGESVAMPQQSGCKKRNSESFNGKRRRQSCNVSMVPYEGRFDNSSANPLMVNQRFNSFQSPEAVQLVHPSSSVFQRYHFDQHCSANNVPSGPCSSLAPLTVHGGGHQFDFELQVPKRHSTKKRKAPNPPVFSSASLFHAFASSNNTLNTSNLQLMSSAASTVLDAPCTKVRRTRQRKKVKQCTASQNYSGPECVVTDSPFCQVTAATFVKKPSVSETYGLFDQKGITSCNIVNPYILMKPACEKYSLSSADAIRSTHLTESLSKAESSDRKCFSLDRQECKADGSVTRELANLPIATSSARNSEPDNVTTGAASSGHLMSIDDRLSKINTDSGFVRGCKEVSDDTAKSSSIASESFRQTTVSQASTYFHLDEKSGLLIAVSTGLQPASLESRDGISTIQKCKSMVSRHDPQELKDESNKQSEQDDVNTDSFGNVKFCSNFNTLPTESFTEEQINLLSENHQEACVDLAQNNLAKAGFLETDLDVQMLKEDSFVEVTAFATDDVTDLDVDDLSAAMEAESCIDGGGLTLADHAGTLLPQNSDATRTDSCVGSRVGITTEDEELSNVETDLSIVVTNDIQESNEGKSSGNISPDSAVVGDVTSVETIEEQETFSVPLLAESPPTDRPLKSLCSEDAVQEMQLLALNQTGSLSDRNDFMKDTPESSISSAMNVCDESVLETDESEKSDVEKFAYSLNDSLNNTNSDLDGSDPVELTLSELSSEDIEVIKLNNKHSALDLPVTHFEDVSRSSKNMLSEDLRHLNALVVCDFDRLVVNSSSLLCVAKVPVETNSKVARNNINCVTKKMCGSLKAHRRHFSLYSLLAKRRMKRKVIGNISVLNKETGHLNRCLMDTSRPVSLSKKFHLRVARDIS